jgi:hypothetical protein
MFGAEVFMVSTSAWLLVVPLGLWLLRGGMWMVAGGVFVVCVWFGRLSGRW